MDCYVEGRDLEMVHWIGARKELHKGRGDFAYYYRCGRKQIRKSTIICDTMPLPAKEIENFILIESSRFLRNPQRVYEYQQQLVSSKAEIQILGKKRLSIRSLLNGIPGERDALRPGQGRNH